MKVTRGAAIRDGGAALDRNNVGPSTSAASVDSRKLPSGLARPGIARGLAVRHQWGGCGGLVEETLGTCPNNDNATEQAHRVYSLSATRESEMQASHATAAHHVTASQGEGASKV